MRSLAELVVDPPGDGPSKGSLPSGRAIMPDLCAADPAADDFSPELMEPGFFTASSFIDGTLVKYRLGTPLPDYDFALSLLTDPALTGSFFTGMATAEPMEGALEDLAGSDLGTWVVVRSL